MIRRELRFRHEPFEWVYEGLAPMFLVNVLSTRKGTPLCLAVLCLAVSCRLGLPLEILPGASQGGPPTLPLKFAPCREDRDP